MAKKKKKPAALDSSDIIVDNSARQPVFILDTDTTHLQNQTHTSANSVKPPCAIFTEYVKPRSEQHSHSYARAGNPHSPEPATDNEKSRTQRAQLLAEYSENFALVARLLMAKEADSRIGWRPFVGIAGYRRIFISHFTGHMCGMMAMVISPVKISRLSFRRAIAYLWATTVVAVPRPLNLCS
ncbi:hypothetical protein F5878DRAFT_668369 [Lentinula raphanica]|uniref:Uncharacterized protein n=1 Tax=Lentinula raphanica TaxID=153919 RepID=A0AA38NUJ3_9AGAR|nr:hypothetical protein F5878DRAFT_668369 [Lentinula raphanica]